jgi:exodeoxyribonuclease VII small subunit
LARKRSEPKAAEGPSFEQGLEQVEEILRQLEEGQIGLDESLKQYEKGVKLLRRCYDLLDRADRRIELLSGVDAEGNPISSPIDDPADSSADRAPGRRRSTREPPARP